MRTPFGLFGANIIACAFWLYLSTATGQPQTNIFPDVTDLLSAEEFWRSMEALPSSQQLQEQHQQLMQAIGLIRQDTEAALHRHANAINLKLDLVNQALASERERELQAWRSSNRFALATASIIVGVVFLEILFLAWLSARAVNRLAARIFACLAGQSLPSATSALSGGNAAYLLAENVMEEANLRLQYGIERLERRLLDLESATTRFQAASQKPPSTSTAKALSLHARSEASAPKVTRHPGVSLTLGDGESLIFLPHDNEATQFRSFRHFLQKLRKRFQPTRIAKSRRVVN